MKLTCTLLLFAATPIAATLAAQTASQPPVHHTATTTAHAPAAKTTCAKLPPLSPKIPALPAGLPCAKPLYTITTIPSAKLEDVSPMEGSGLREYLGLEPVSITLSYVDTKVGTGELAAPKKWYTINYAGYLADGTKFDSSDQHGEPLTIQIVVHGVIPGWDTGLDGMRVGGKRRLFIPFQLGYGASSYPPNGATVIPARSELIFDVELLSLSSEKPAPPAPKTQPAPPASEAPQPPAATSAPVPPAPPPAPQAPAPAPPPQ